MFWRINESNLGYKLGVTCPTFRIHPVIIAQAAATGATMMPGRFFLGDHISIHQIGRNQEACMDFYAQEIFPKIFTKPLLQVA